MKIWQVQPPSGDIHPQHAIPILVGAFINGWGTGKLQICNGKKPVTSRNNLVVCGVSLVKSAMITDRRLLGLKRFFPFQNNSQILPGTGILASCAGLSISAQLVI
jgi:hypothetical protein